MLSQLSTASYEKRFYERRDQRLLWAATRNELGDICKEGKVAANSLRVQLSPIPLVERACEPPAEALTHTKVYTGARLRVLWASEVKSESSD